MKKTLYLIRSLLLRPVNLFDTWRYRIGFVGGLFLFLTIFLYLFTPFSITHWIDSVSPFRRFALPSLAVLGGLILLFSHLSQSWVLRKSHIRIIHLVIGFFGDVLLISLILNALYITTENNYWQVLPETLRIVALLLGLGYLIGILCLLLILQQVEKRPKEMPSTLKLSKIESLPDRLNICDENGQLRISLLPTDLLYLESADNYVMVCFRKGDRLMKEMVRNTLKRMEMDLPTGYGCRCHRSYLINLNAVSFIRKSGRDYVAIIDPLKTEIPISRAYVKVVKELLAD